METTSGILGADGFLVPGQLEPPTRTFHWADYVVFGLTLLVAVIIGNLILVGSDFYFKITIEIIINLLVK
jgi:hypothetical protein